MSINILSKRQIVLDYLTSERLSALQTQDYHRAFTLTRWLKFMQYAQERSEVLQGYAEYRRAIDSTPAQPIQPSLF